MDSRGSSHRTPYMPRIRNADENRISSPSANANNGSQRSSTGSAMLRASPYSPFPFGLPIQSSNRSILSPGSIDQELSRNEDVNKKDLGDQNEDHEDHGDHEKRVKINQDHDEHHHHDVHYYERLHEHLHEHH